MTAPHEEHQALGSRISNWGRWGEDDQLGTLNFVTDAKRLQAAGSVRTGQSFDLGIAFDSAGPQGAGTFRGNPVHLMTATPLDARPTPDGQISSDDMITMHLQCATQWDGLAHVGYAGSFYNGMPAAAVTTKRGATRNGFELAANRLITRGVLLDVARLRGVERLDPEYEITADDLDAAEEAQGVRLEPGDMLLVRTGHDRLLLDGDRERYMGPAPGLGWRSAEWLQLREVAGVAVDNWSCERWPSTVPGSTVPFHQIAIRDVGLLLGEMFILDALAHACAGDGVWDFLFSGTGLKITGAVGSPVTPIAIR